MTFSPKPVTTEASNNNLASERRRPATFTFQGRDYSPIEKQGYDKEVNEKIKFNVIMSVLFVGLAILLAGVFTAIFAPLFLHIFIPLLVVGGISVIVGSVFAFKDLCKPTKPTPNPLI